MITRMSQSYRKSGSDKTVLVKNNWWRSDSLRVVLMALCISLTSAFVGAETLHAAAAVLSPAQLAGKENQRVTVTFRVRSTGKSYRSTYDELYSEHSWDHPQSFIVRIPKTVKTQMEERGVMDVARHFYGRYIEVSGVVELIEFGDIGRYTLEVEQAQDIRRAPEVETIPTADYLQRDIGGFTVLLSPAVVQQAPLFKEVMDAIEDQISAMAGQLPVARLEQLKQTFIWVELNNEVDKATVFHRSPDWIVASAGNQDKVGHIEIVNAKNFIDCSRDKQPSQLLHEFIHAFHQKVLGADNKAVIDTYRQMQLRRMYDRVEHLSGSVGPGYATLGPLEYFAEISEAYFGRNDYYPFDRAQLKTHDPIGHDLVEKLWLGNAADAAVVTKQ